MIRHDVYNVFFISFLLFRVLINSDPIGWMCSNWITRTFNRWDHIIGSQDLRHIMDTYMHFPFPSPMYLKNQLLEPFTNGRIHIYIYTNTYFIFMIILLLWLFIFSPHYGQDNILEMRKVAV